MNRWSFTRKSGEGPGPKSVFALVRFADPIYRSMAGRIVGTLWLAISMLGCHNVPHGGQHFDVRLTAVDSTEQSPRRVAVLEEVYRVKGAPDSSAGWSETLIRSDLRCVVDGHFSANSPKMTDHFVWAFNDRVEYRWTLFSPGFVITTIYPEGYTLSWWNPDTGNKPFRRMSVGWQTSRDRPMDSTWYGIGVGSAVQYPSAAMDVSITLPLRPLRPERAVRLEPFATTLPAAVTNEDAGNFNDQLRSLALALERIGRERSDLQCRRLLWQAIQDQHNALVRAGFSINEGDDSSQGTETQRIDHIRVLLLD